MYIVRVRRAPSMRQICLAFVAITMTACFSFHGPPYGGEGEECWRDPNAPPCDKGLVCYDGRCEKPRLGSCTTSIECSDGQACNDGQCLHYAATCAFDSNCRADYFCGPDGECLKRQANEAACTAAKQCLSDFCSDGVCRDIKLVGESCSSGRECEFGFCVDGVCCQSACTDKCQSCIASTNGVADGACLVTKAGLDPRSDCAGDVACNGHGACAYADTGRPCTKGNECGSSFCVDGICCESACTDKCMSCAASINGVANGACLGTKAGLDPRSDCAGGVACNGHGACAYADSGQPCARGSQCKSGSCADGVCCNSQCDGLCQSCVKDANGVAAKDGVCRNFKGGTDPDAECVAGVCNGVGGCVVKGLGQACSKASECASNFCTDGVCCDNSCDGPCMTCGSTGHCSTFAYREDVGICDSLNAPPGSSCRWPPCVCAERSYLPEWLPPCIPGRVPGTTCKDDRDCNGQFCRNSVCCLIDLYSVEHCAP